jgi:DNA helicase-2/ATP-dependent DNA helicase PcrA
MALDIEHALNAEQCAVVRGGDGPCLVLAGAGSGKTRTVTYRVAHLLEQGVAPDEILLVTFTNKAAREMQNRIAEITGRAEPLPWSGTFHHIAVRMLREHAARVGYVKYFTILDGDDAADLVKLCLKQEGIDRGAKRFPSANVILSIVSFARNAGRTIADVLDERYPQWAELLETIEGIADAYDKRKRETKTMDFDDLLVFVHRLLATVPDVRESYARAWRYILVDEYQDTNWIQGQILNLLAAEHKNLLVVGDDAQSIYAFRAATIENILSFEKNYPGAKIFRLETNYRSTPEILSVANDVIARNVRQYPKALKSMLPPAHRPWVQAFADERDEARFIVREIMRLYGEGASYDSIAVLFRAAHHSQAVEMELTRSGIRYDYRGGLKFFERSHVKDALAYLKIIHNPSDAVAWSRVLNQQIGIGPAGAQKLFDTIQKNGLPDDMSELGELLSAKGRLGWQDFAAIWRRLTGVEDRHPAALIFSLLSSVYVTHLEQEYPDARDRIRDIEQLARIAERQKDLQAFLTEVSLSDRFENEDAQRGKVVLSTIHQAKGLEWGAVFLLHLVSGQFPNDRALREDGGLEEERRLFYVAVTRAKEHLYLTYPMAGARDTQFDGPSQFLGEIGHTLLQGDTVESDEPVYVSEDEPFTSKKSPSGGFLKGLDEL